MVDSALGIAFTAGIFATFNPCGFAMLPAYLSLAILESGRNENRVRLLLRAVKFATLMGLGILGVFSLFSLIIFPISTSIQKYLPFVTIILGAVVLVLGAVILVRGPIIVRKLWSPQVSPTGKSKTYILYGVTFALGSISCTIGPFLAITSRALNESYLDSLLIYLTYGAGFIVTILLLALLTAFSQQMLVKRIRDLGAVIEKITAAILLVVGIYLIYFGITEVALQYGKTDQSSILEIAYRVQGFVISVVSALLRGIGLM